MAYLKIREVGDPVLRTHCRPVDAITPRIKTLLDDMKDTLHRANGCGLAAPQVGILRRVVIIETEESGLIELINPIITEKEGEQLETEGCLSIPGQWGITRRPVKVTVKALDREGEMREYHGEGLLARALCHEIDHLDGKLYIDKGVFVRVVEDDELEEEEEEDTDRDEK